MFSRVGANEDGTGLQLPLLTRNRASACEINKSVVM